MKIYEPIMRPLKRSANNKLSSNFGFSRSSASTILQFSIARLRCNLLPWLSQISFMFWNKRSSSRSSSKRRTAQVIQRENWSNNNINNKLQSQIHIVGCTENTFCETKGKKLRNWFHFDSRGAMKGIPSVNLWVKCVVGGFKHPQWSTLHREIFKASWVVEINKKSSTECRQCDWVLPRGGVWVTWFKFMKVWVEIINLQFQKHFMFLLSSLVWFLKAWHSPEKTYDCLISQTRRLTLCNKNIQESCLI